MNEQQLRSLIESVTAQVLANLAAPAAPCCDGRKKVLRLGCGEVPPSLLENAVCFDIEDYGRDPHILRYDRVVITALTFPQLADIATGRGGDSVSEAVLTALLSGVEVYITETALPHRSFAGKGSPPLYQLLESYAATLGVYGVKPAESRFVPAPLPPAKPAKFAQSPTETPKGSARPNACRLITESTALELLRQGDTVTLPAGAILTPSARDVFAQAKVTLCIGD